jgi:ribonuclease HI/retron-type reverse transcriptase
MTYESLGWRSGSQSTASARTRRVPVDAHVGTPQDYVRRLERAAREAVRGTGRDEYFRNLLPWAVDTRNLLVAWDYLASGDGDAPGVDGLTFSDFDSTMKWEYLRGLNAVLLDGDYIPCPLRQCEIPRGPGRPNRILDLPTIADRVIGRALMQAIMPYVDPQLDENSFGFRPRRNRQDALATAEALSTRQERWVWLPEDIRDAFPNVPRGRLHDVVRLFLPNDELLEMIMALADNGRQRGIPQGQPLCPLLLNLYLTHVLDRPWRQHHPDLPLIRVADDLLVLCRTAEEARSTHQELIRLLRPAGMPLKGSPGTAIRDVGSGETANWLGFQVGFHHGELRIGLSDRSWHRLEQNLALDHTKPNAPVRAIQTLQGWIDQAGPTYNSTDAEATVVRARESAHHYGFVETPSVSQLTRRYGIGHARWEHTRRTTADRLLRGCAIGSADPHQNYDAPCRAGAEPPPAPPAALPAVTIWTDGACLGNPGVGGYAFSIVDSDGARYTSTGSAMNTTNNRMELTAVLTALRAIDQPSIITFISDSELVVRGINEWLCGWRDQDWQAGSGRHRRPLQNSDLWQAIDGELQRHEYQAQWIEGHSGCDENDQCDLLARFAAQNLYDNLLPRG